jgi:hypothetical protein
MKPAQDTPPVDGRPTRVAPRTRVLAPLVTALLALAAAPLAAQGTPAAAPPPVDTALARPVAAPAVSGVGGSPLRPATRAPLRAAPDGRGLGTLESGAIAVPLARERGWVRVRVEGWVRERDLVPADSALRTGVSAADLRADPEGSRGTVVRWDVEVLAFQRADALRRDLQLGEPYLLARGPAGENALLYLALPAALVDEARAIAPLTTVRVTARVRTGRAQPTNVPILDVTSIARS